MAAKESLNKDNINRQDNMEGQSPTVSRGLTPIQRTPSDEGMLSMGEIIFSREEHIY